jgi:hypothetical protein
MENVQEASFLNGHAIFFDIIVSVSPFILFLIALLHQYFLLYRSVGNIRVVAVLLFFYILLLVTTDYYHTVGIVSQSRCVLLILASSCTFQNLF